MSSHCPRRAVPPALAALAVACLVATAARAGEDDAEKRARTQFEVGLRLYEEGEFEKASVAFATAYQLKPSYRILFNIGQTENELERYARAYEAYRRYLAEGGDEIEDERAKQVKAEIARLEALVGRIDLTCEAEGATVLVDGQRRGETPLDGPMVVDLGEHEVLVKLGGRELHREVVRVGGGLTLDLLIETPDDAGRAAGAAPTEESARATEDGAAPEGAAGGAAVEADGPKRVWTWVALGVAGAAGAGAAVTGGLASARASQLESDCPGKVCADGRDLDAARSLATATDALIGVAAAGAAIAIVLFFVEPGDGADEAAAAEVSVAPLVDDEGAGLAIGGRF